MWTAIAITGSCLGLWLVIRQCRTLPDFPTQFLLLVVWLRYALQAFPQYTVLVTVSGFSVISLFAIASTGGLFVISEKSLYRLRFLISLYAFFCVVIISSLISQTLGGLLRDAMKWIYFLAVLVSVYRGMVIFGLPRIARALLWTTATPLILQAASVVLGRYKIGEDESVSYIGGYFHEGLFSIIVLTFICLVVITRLRSARLEFLLIAFGLLSLMLTNYRTTIIAVIPIVLLVLWNFVSRPWGSRLQLIFASIVGIFVIVSAPFLPSFVPERYSDVIHIFDNMEVLTKSPMEFNDSEKELLSGRILLWAEYLQAISDSSSVDQLIGQGSLSYEGRMRLFAHNTFISYLYEFGFIGLALISYVLLSNFALAFTAPDADLCSRLAVMHLAFIGLNFLTMPLWSTEGMTLFAIILASTWAALSRLPVSSNLARI